jgi:sugar phosphate isomerase/epimerase
MNRRTFTASAIALSAFAVTQQELFANAATRKFTIDFCPGRLGVQTNQFDTIALAAKYRFESVEPFVETVGGWDQAKRDEALAMLAEKKLVWGAAGLPVEFRQSDDKFNEGLAKLPEISKGLKAAGVTRIGTWLGPNSDELTYVQNFRRHAKRLSSVAAILSDHGLRFGLEYVGPKTLWAGKRYPFIHTMAETMDLIAEINQPNVGLVLDSWHWYTSGEDRTTLNNIRQEQIIAVDLNDAPNGIERDKQIDSKRELPAATGVIDVAEFLDYLIDVGYDGPVRAEPFNQVLNEKDDDEAARLTSEAMYKAIVG